MEGEKGKSPGVVHTASDAPASSTDNSASELSAAVNSILENSPLRSPECRGIPVGDDVEEDLLTDETRNADLMVEVNKAKSIEDSTHLTKGNEPTTVTGEVDERAIKASPVSDDNQHCASFEERASSEKQRSETEIKKGSPEKLSAGSQVTQKCPDSETEKTVVQDDDECKEGPGQVKLLKEVSSDLPSQDSKAGSSARDILDGRIELDLASTQEKGKVEQEIGSEENHGRENSGKTVESLPLSCSEQANSRNEMDLDCVQVSSNAEQNSNSTTSLPRIVQSSSSDSRDNLASASINCEQVSAAFSDAQTSSNITASSKDIHTLISAEGNAVLDPFEDKYDSQLRENTTMFDPDVNLEKAQVLSSEPSTTKNDVTKELREKSEHTIEACKKSGASVSGQTAEAKEESDSFFSLNKNDNADRAKRHSVEEAKCTIPSGVELASEVDKVTTENKEGAKGSSEIQAKIDKSSEGGDMFNTHRYIEKDQEMLEGLQKSPNRDSSDVHLVQPLDSSLRNIVEPMNVSCDEVILSPDSEKDQDIQMIDDPINDSEHEMVIDESEENDEAEIMNFDSEKESSGLTNPAQGVFRDGNCSSEIRGQSLADSNIVLEDKKNKYGDQPSSTDKKGFENQKQKVNEPIEKTPLVGHSNKRNDKETDLKEVTSSKSSPVFDGSSAKAGKDQAKQSVEDVSSAEAREQTHVSTSKEISSLKETPDESMECEVAIISVKTCNQSSEGSNLPPDGKKSAGTVEHGVIEGSGTDLDEDLCIVPDTEPRVLTDEEKAVAFGNVNKSCSTIPEICPEKANKSCQESAESKALKETASGKSANTSEASTDIDTEESDKRTDTSSRTFSIHLKATSSLVSKQGSPKKNEGEDKGLPQQGDSDCEILTENVGSQKCADCGKVKECKYQMKQMKGVYLCEDDCYNRFRRTSETTPTPTHVASSIRARRLDHSSMHKCGECGSKVDTKSEKAMNWETMDFCSDECLGKYQRVLGSCCANCKGAVQQASLGKYCVRFGYDMKQFCCAPCLEDFKKGLKVCSYCQKDISSGAEGFLAPVGDKGQFKDFCTQECMEKYELMSNNIVPPEVSHECAVCNENKVVKVEVLIDSKVQKLCSEPCFAAFKFVNGISADQCDMCKKYFDRDRDENYSVFYDDVPHSFCCKTCMNVYILAKRKIVPCIWCKVKKYNFDMIKKFSGGQSIVMCSLNCYNSYRLSLPSATPAPPVTSLPTTISTIKQVKCDSCGTHSQLLFSLSMSDSSLRSFCSYECVLHFQGLFPTKTSVPIPGSDKTPHPIGGPRRIFPKRLTPVSSSVVEKDQASTTSSMPVISSVTSLAPLAATNGLCSSNIPVSTASIASTATAKSVGTEPVKTVYKQQFILRPRTQPSMSNSAVQVKPLSMSKAVTCVAQTSTAETQTDDTVLKPVLIPVPVPIYIPTPMHMYSSPYPVPVPIVLPIPVPIFIPTTRNSAKGIFKEIKRIQEKFPSDPYEAELLMMAEMVAGDKKKAEDTDTESEDSSSEKAVGGENISEKAQEPDLSAENVDAGNTFGDDVLQMALKMASELEEPPVDFEAAVTASTIAQAVPTKTVQPEELNDESEEDDVDSQRKVRSGLKRGVQSAAISPNSNSKRARISNSSDHGSVSSLSDSTVSTRTDQVEKPDANMCLKFTLAVNAWKSWVNQKNTELEKASGTPKKVKLFKTDLLQLTADELNYALCLFIKEARKPNGQEYTPDTIYYITLGIQQYLLENGRLENIFSDPYYEKFTDCLDEFARKFISFFTDEKYLVTRVEEEHLWESKQLGAHSPYVLLSTLMFFTTKYFKLTTVDEHMQLSFSHIMKHWKRNPNVTGGPKAPGSRSVLLRFYPPQAALAANSKKKKVYEQQENEENPLRCPVKLYEFYLLKCPESVKTRNDVFYLQPERSCVPDSPVWYSTMALGREQLQKMLHRIKMVKETSLNSM